MPSVEREAPLIHHLSWVGARLPSMVLPPPPVFERHPVAFSSCIWALVAAALYPLAGESTLEFLNERVWIQSGMADSFSYVEWHAKRVGAEMAWQARSLLPPDMTPGHYVLYGAIGLGVAYAALLPLALAVGHALVAWGAKKARGAGGGAFRAPVKVAKVLWYTPLEELWTTWWLVLVWLLCCALFWFVLLPPIDVVGGGGWGGSGYGQQQHQHQHRYQGGKRHHRGQMAGPPPVEQHYRTLGLQKGVTAEEVKKAYRRLAVELHPDKNPEDPEAATDKFVKVAESYEAVLLDLDGKYDPPSRR